MTSSLRILKWSSCLPWLHKIRSEFFSVGKEALNGGWRRHMADKAYLFGSCEEFEPREKTFCNYRHILTVLIFRNHPCPLRPPLSRDPFSKYKFTPVTRLTVSSLSHWNPATFYFARMCPKARLNFFLLLNDLKLNLLRKRPGCPLHLRTSCDSLKD